MSKVLIKWNPANRTYEPYEIPDGWNVAIYSDDMDRKINCAGCGKEIKYGEGYTSLEIHNHVGFGFSVCGRCHHEEIIRSYERHMKKGREQWEKK